MMANKSVWLVVLMLIGVQPCLGQKEIDSLERELRQVKADTMRIKILEMLVKVLPEGKGDNYIDDIETLSLERLKTVTGKEKTFYLGALCSAYNSRSINYGYRGETAKELEFAEKSLAIAKEIGNKIYISTIEYNTAKLLHLQGDISRCITYVQHALKLSEEADYTLLQSYCLNYLGFISKEQGEWQEALKFHESALAVGKKIDNKSAMGTSLACMGAVYSDQKMWPESLDALRKSLVLYTEIDDKQNMAIQYQLLGATYQYQQMYDSAFKYLLKAHELNRISGEQIEIAISSNSLGENYLGTGDIATAEKYFNEGITIAKKMGFPKQIYQSADGLYRLYKKKGETKNALNMYELYIHMRDSMNNEENRKKAMRVKYQYEYEKKATADSVRNFEEKKVIEAQLSQERTQRYALLTGILLIVTLAGTGIYRLRTKQRIKELSLRNSIASDLHDDVGSALSSISLFAGVARMNQTMTHESIARIEATSRETIENMSDIVWSIKPANDHFGNVLIKMKHFGESVCASAGVQFSFYQDEALEKLSFDMKRRKNIYLIYKEAVNNALKYAHAGALDVNLSKEGKQFVMTIRDDGNGFDAKSTVDGNGIKNMEQRAEEIGALFQLTSGKGGTSITVSMKLS